MNKIIERPQRDSFVNENKWRVERGSPERDRLLECEGFEHQVSEDFLIRFAKRVKENDYCLYAVASRRAISFANTKTYARASSDKFYDERNRC